MDIKDYPAQAEIADTDRLVGQTGAGGGVSYAGSAFAKRDANGRIFDGFGSFTTAASTDWNDASNARSGQGVGLLQGNHPNGPQAAGSALFHPFSFDYAAVAGNMTQFAIPYSASIGAGMWMRGNNLGIWSVWRQILSENGSDSFAPATDNAKALGAASARFSVVYAGTGSINTSDAREKQQIEPIPDAWLDAWADVEWSRFKFNDAVAVKGAKNARWHTGLVAQAVRDAFANHGLDAAAIGLIGLLCHDEWDGTPATPEVVNEAGEVVTPARPAGEGGDRWGLRYEEGFAIEAAYQRRRMAVIEARLAAMEARD